MARRRFQRTSGQASAGFTLVELLVAFTLLGLIALMSLGALQFGARVWDRTSETNDAFNRVRATQSLIRQQIGRIEERPCAVGVASGTPVLTGKLDAISFVAPLPFSLDTGRLYRQSVTIADTPSGGQLVLHWQDPDVEANADPAGASALLLPDVVGARYAYLAPGRGSRAPAWQDRWDEADLPLLVRLQVDFEATAPLRWPALVVAPREVLP